MIVRNFLSSHKRYIYIQTFCIHKRNVLRFLQHGTYHEVVRGGSHFCQSPKGGESEVFLKKRKGGPTLFLQKKKYQNSPALPPPPRKNVPSLKNIHQWVSAFNIFVSVYTERFRDENPQLKCVRDFAVKTGSWLWYNEQLRPEKLPWDQIHWELWMRASSNVRRQHPFINKLSMTPSAGSSNQPQLTIEPCHPTVHQRVAGTSNFVTIFIYLFK